MILHLWSHLFSPLLDILLMSFCFYRLLLLVRGTYTVQVLIGLATLMGLTIGVYFLGLPACKSLLEIFWRGSVVILAVVFQPELRTALARLGSHPMGKILLPNPLGFIDEIIGAVREAMQRQMGMLLVLEQDVGLRNYTETGTMINGELSKELLLSIFHYRSPLHDGAALIQGDRLIAVGCLLPLSNDPSLAKILGTRHRAAVGLSEFTDAIVIVVSEETGGLSLARGGHLQRELSPEDLQTILMDLYQKRMSISKDLATNDPAPASHS